ncbi:DUF4382 domain-containing protein [Salinimicrobium flavum]|uniref:DUF4382 domain-containing protein n=1 Tax=Salinimicrobium flavum TaxID=1737065 RepID=A0ABW5IZN2_9FLAO
MTLKSIFKPTLFLFFVSLMVSCSSDDDDQDLGPETGKYNTAVYITDAPVDNAEISGVFVTIAGVKVNGTSLEGFQKTTVEVSSLTNGSTELLGNLDLEADANSTVVLELDNDADESGNTPGSYVLTAEGEKKALTSASNEITLTDKAEVLESDDNELIIDFDLRKTIGMNGEGEYTFANDSQLANGIRVVNNLNTGTITGTVSNMNTSEAETVIVFAYEKGSYDNSESQEDANGVNFTNAVTSSVVNEANGDFSLHFVEEGDYELHFVSFEDVDADGQLEVEGEVNVTSAAGVDLGVVTVTADSTTSIEILLAGLVDL